MSTRAKALAAVILVAGGLALVLALGGGGAVDPPAPPDPGGGEANAVDPTRPEESIEAESRRVADEPAPEARVYGEALVHGRVRGLAPLESGAGLEVRITLRTSDGTSTEHVGGCDEEARFAFRVEAPAILRGIEVAASDATPGVLDWVHVFLRPEAEFEHELVLPRSFSMRGRVVDERGGALSGAVVKAWCRPLYEQTLERPPDRTTITGVDGTFELAGLSPRFALVAELEGFVCQYGATDDEGGPLSEVEGVELLMVTARVWSGTVRDPEGLPVPDCEVAVRTTSGRGGVPSAGIPGVRRFLPFRRSARTDSAGHFRLERMPARVLSATALHPGYRRWTGLLDEEKARDRIVLERGASLHGSVLDGEGHPVVGAEVKVRDRVRLLETETAADGSYELAGIDESVELVLSCLSGAHRLHVEPPFVVEPGSRVRKDLFLERGVRLSGVVLDADGVPAPFAEVRIAGERVVEYPSVEFARPQTFELLAGRDRVRADAAGSFELPHLHRGRYTLTAKLGDTLAKSLELDLIEDRSIEVRLESAPRTTLSGMVLDANTLEPVDRFELRVLTAEASGAWRAKSIRVQSEEGAFEALVPAVRDIRYQVRSDGYLGWESSTMVRGEAEGGTGEVVHLQPAAELQLLVLQDDGSPVSPGTLVSVFDESGERQRIGLGDDSSSMSAELVAGRVLLRDLPAGRLRLQLDRPGWREVHTHTLVLPPFERTEETVVLALDPELEWASLLLVGADEDGLAELSTISSGSALADRIESSEHLWWLDEPASISVRDGADRVIGVAQLRKRADGAGYVFVWTDTGGSQVSPTTWPVGDVPLDPETSVLQVAAEGHATRTGRLPELGQPLGTGWVVPLVREL